MTDYIKTMREKIGHDRLLFVGTGVYVYNDGKVLLQRRRDNLCWACHGGAVEVGEKVEDATKRELLEETGLIANGLELLGVFSGEEMLYTYPNGDEVYIIGICYVCKDFSGELLEETDEVLELRWFDIDDLPKEIHSPDKASLKLFVEHIKKT